MNHSILRALPLITISTLATLAACSSSTSSSPTVAPAEGGADAGADSSTRSEAGTSAEAGTDAAPATGACFVLPAGAVKQGTGCTGVSGTYTEVTFDTAANTYNEACMSPDPYPDQATFDANEGTSGAAGVTITSNEDYVVTPTCASGSVEYTPSGGTKSKIVFLWTKVP